MDSVSRPEEACNLINHHRACHLHILNLLQRILGIPRPNRLETDGESFIGRRLLRISTTIVIIQCMPGMCSKDETLLRIGTMI